MLHFAGNRYICNKMRKLILKIVHGLVLLIIGVALVGVNVQQLYCSHSDHLLWQVHLLPVETGCPCEEKCCEEEDCHGRIRYDFYKITDFSRIETGIQLPFLPFYLSESLFSILRIIPVERGELPCFRHEIPDRIMYREMLCTYLC